MEMSQMTTLLLLLSGSLLVLCGEALSHAKNTRPPQPLHHIFNSGTDQLNAESSKSSTYQTSTDDIDGLKALAKKFTFIQSLWFDFGGDPCGFDSWPWLTCSNSTPPRVTELFLPHYSLNAELPVFSQMQALETIDFSDNSLHGSIPSFLGKLPNLKQLDLSNNHFSGNIPWSIVENQNLTYSLYGNPQLEAPKKEKKKKNLGLLIGLPLGLFFGLVLPGFAVFLLTRRKPLPRRPSLMTGTVQANNIENGSGISKENLNKPPAPSSSHELNQVEVNELLQLHSTKRNDLPCESIRANAMR